MKRRKEERWGAEGRGFYTPAATKARVLMALTASGFVNALITQVFRMFQGKVELAHGVVFVRLFGRAQHLACALVFRK